jgi:transketolase
MVSTHLGLDNLTVLYDHNHSQERCLPIPNPGDRFGAFGCTVHDVDGHDLRALTQALGANGGGVRVVVANTVKGYGCKTLAENMYEWHRRSPNADQLGQLLGELHAGTV